MANQKIPTIFAKVGDITRQHCNAWNSDISVLHAPHKLGGGDNWLFRLAFYQVQRYRVIGFD